MPFYLLVGGSAAVQNVVPIPVADLVVLFGAFLMATSFPSIAGVFLAAWLGNAGVAAIIYFVARHYRARRPQSRLVRRLLKGGDAESPQAPRKWDPFSVFVASFLPARPLLPVFGGLGGVAFWRVVAPIGAAAAAWYTAIVLVGTTGGRNFQAVTGEFATLNRWLLWVVGALVVAAAAWWLVRRHRR